MVPIFRELNILGCVRQEKGCEKGNPESHCSADSTK